MGYVFDFNDAVAYDRWYESPENRTATERQTRLMLDLLKPVKGETILDIGCGTGKSLLPFLDMGLQATGLDASQYMIDIAVKKTGNRADFHRGFAEDLPFEDNSFAYACLNTTLEFVEDPEKTLKEAFRVTKDRVFLGVLNKYAIKGIHRRIKGIFIESIYNRAKFFSIWELKQMIHTHLGNVPLEWRTVCQFPATAGRVAAQLERLERSELIQRCPFGEFTGMVVTLVPRFKTKPLSLRYHPKHTTGEVVG
jgi:ubiquinone/menaquinone biosynthesis C-methylase UbiE